MDVASDTSFLCLNVVSPCLVGTDDVYPGEG
jgi:hypothetical protein